MFSTSLRNASATLIKNLSKVSTIKMSSVPTFETLNITVPKPFVYHVELNRPAKMNAINGQMWEEIGKCLEDLSYNSDCRVIILSGAGKVFTAGIDLTTFTGSASKLSEEEDLARKANLLYPGIVKFQNWISSVEKCPKPVLTAVHNACIGAGVDLITATDMRYCTKDSYFQVKEIIIGMAADVGTLQRLPKVIGSQSLVRELCFTGRKLPAEEALGCGLVSKVYENKENMLTEVLKTAEEIAGMSPVAVQATKRNLNYSRDHTVQEGLDHIANINQFLLQSEDFANGVMSQMSKQAPVYSKL